MNEGHVYRGRRTQLEGALGRRLTDTQLQLVASLYELYVERGLIRDGAALSLADACACGPACWRREDPTLVPEEKAGVSLPWVGSGYVDTRVCVLGINFRCDGGLDAHWRLTETVIDHLSRGRKRVHQTTFGYRAGLAAASVAQALQGDGGGQEPPDTSAERAAEGWEACAFLQLVKCSPWRDRSEPNETMWANCPNLYLGDELGILAPRVLLILGSGEADDRLRSLGLATRWERSAHIQRGEIRFSDFALEVLAIPHPSARRVSWPALVESLRDSIAQVPPPHESARGGSRYTAPI